ncbi:MAG: TIGR03364 family FAD-dependent oxidoreductase [Actinomycetes bacterium]
MKRVLIVGGGIIGTMHAILAAEKGFAVTHLERDMKPQSASVRNFGLIWVSGRLAGAELDLALRARELWGLIGSRADIGFRANGSLTIAQTEAEFTVIQEAAGIPDAQKRGFRTLNKKETIAIEPELAGNYVGALQCTTDAAVEPTLLLDGLRNYLKAFSQYTWLPNFEVVDFFHDDKGNHVSDLSGKMYSGDYVAICAGAAHKGFIEEFLDKAPLRKVRLQMASTAPLGAKLGHSLADADSMRYYPAFKDLSLNLLGPQSEIAAEFKMQLLLVQRLDGSMTIGDTHEYNEPFTHEIHEAPYDHLYAVMNNIFGRAVPRIEKRWDGVYSQSTSNDIYVRKEIAPGAHLVTGVGGRGNTLSPAIAEETVNQWSL